MPIRDGLYEIKKKNFIKFLELIKLLRKIFFNKNKFNKIKKYEYILVSRSDSFRKLLNELELYKTLKNINSN